VRRSIAGLGFDVLMLALGASACSPEPGQRPAVDTEVQDVAPPPDAELSTAADPQARAAAPAFSGVLPESFPKDVPPYVPSTLVDFGDRWIELQTPDAPATVRARYLALLRGRGWAGDGTRFTKGPRTFTVRFEDARPGTKIRVEY
jgi:hypothetical protein